MNRFLCAVIYILLEKNPRKIVNFDSDLDKTEKGRTKLEEFLGNEIF